VDTAEIKLQTVRVAAERLEHMSGAALIAWVGDKYRPAVSYTSALLANRFNLVVDGGGECLILFGGNKNAAVKLDVF